MPSSVLGAVERRRSRAAPRGGSPSSAGRSTGPCPCRAAAARSGRSRGRSRTALPETGAPSTRRCFSSRCQPRGRTTIVASSSSGLQRVGLAAGAGEVDRAVERVAQVELAADHVVPERGVGVLEVGQPDLGARVERVDRHLPVGRAGDLDPAVHQAGRGRRDPPARVLADVGWSRAGSRACRPPTAPPGGRRRASSSSGAARAELALESGHEGQRLGREDLVEPVAVGPVISTRSVPGMSHPPSSLAFILGGRGDRARYRGRRGAS